MSTSFEILMQNKFVAQAVERLKAHFPEGELTGAKEEDLETGIKDLILTVMKVSESPAVRFGLEGGEGSHPDEQEKPQDADLFGDCEPSDPEGFNRAMWEIGVKQGFSEDLLTHTYGPRPKEL